MYHYVENKELISNAKALAVFLLKELVINLREVGINSEFFLIGSGARNMITQNEEEPIDLDYNLNIISCDDINDCRYIKETVRKEFNKVLRKYKFSDCDYSSSSLTTKRFVNNNDELITFTMDVGIVTKDRDGSLYRLILKKGNNSYHHEYYWNKGPSTLKINKKVKSIKEVPGYWSKVRERYLDIKNMYLVRNDHYHPSFVCYIQAVNEVYNKMKKKIIK